MVGFEKCNNIHDTWIFSKVTYVVDTIKIPILPPSLLQAQNYE